MNKVYNFISLAVMAFAAIGCIEDIHTDMPSAERGDEVLFGLSLDGPKTKTVYGMEASDAFPVYWVNGDKVAVYSPECLTGRNSAEYQVSVPEDAAQNYADQLTKTGEAGVQWGSSDNATFYSIYPSANATISGTGNEVVASLNIPATQLLTHTLVNGTYYASDMNSVIMYAKKEASKSDEAVNLQYTPYSTVIEFELNGDFTSNTNASIFIESLTLTAAAPATEGAGASYLAGNFNFKFTDTPEISATGNNRSNVTLQFTTQPELNNTNKTLKAKMCLMPIGAASLDGWTVSVTFREGDNTTTTRVKTLQTKNNESTALNAGKVHKIKLPALTATKEWAYTPEAWMPQLPEFEKIYLTELSIPGAWYAGLPVNEYVGTSRKDYGYQSESSFSNLWTMGIRAFGVECRSYSERKAFSGRNNPTRICLSGLGSDDDGAYTDQLVNGKTKFISTIIADIANAVAETDEFAVLVLSYADGGEGGHDDVDYEYFLQGLQSEINLSKATNIVSEITPTTTISDVQGKLIIKVNVDSRVNYDCSNINAILSSALIPKNQTFNEVVFADMHYGSWSKDQYFIKVSPSIKNNDFLWCFYSANRTQLDTGTNSDIPTYSERLSVLKLMMEHSKEIYDKSTHNVWFYFNCGGTQTIGLNDDTDDSGGTNAKNFAKFMNPKLLEIIERKTNGYYENNIHYPSDPSPLGIVMFNQCTNDTYNGPEIVKAIIEMNNKFKLKREGGIENTLVGVDSWDTELL